MGFGPAFGSASGKGLEFDSYEERDAFFSVNLALLYNGLPITVYVGDGTVESLYWDGTNKPTSYDSTLWEKASVRAGTGSFELDQAITLSAGGENVPFYSNATDKFYHPGWQSYVSGRDGHLSRRKEDEVGVAVQSDVDTNITNPDWAQTIAALRPIVSPGSDDEDGTVLNWVEYTFDSSSALTNIKLQSFLNDVLFLEAKYPVVTPDGGGIARLVLPNPFDSFVGQMFRNVVTSKDGDVVLKGNPSNVPYIKAGLQFFDDLPVATFPDLDRAVGQLILDSPTSVSLSVINQPYKITGTYSDGGTNREFATSAGGILEYTGEDGRFLVNGTSDLEVNKASRVTYMLYVNGTLVTGAETPHDFASNSKIENISITRIVDVSNGDEIEVYAKSDTVNTNIDVNDLSVNFVRI